MNKLTLTKDISESLDRPFYVENSYEFPYDASLDDLFHVFKQILIALTYSESQVEEYMREYNGEV